MNTFSPEYFSELFDQNPDPWGFRTRWYEARKRALTLACLPRATYRYGYEPGCANGELAADLAARCERLLVSDCAARAVASARLRLADMPHVEIAQLQTPNEWPEADFDLIVVSEIAYYLSEDSFTRLSEILRLALNNGATVVAVHWRHPITSCTLTGDDVHGLWTKRFQISPVCGYTDNDANVDVWCLDGGSVAEREGLV